MEIPLTELKENLLKGINDSIISDVEMSKSSRDQRKKIIGLKDKILNDVIKNLQSVKIDKIDSSVDIADVISFDDVLSTRKQRKQIQTIRDNLLKRVEKFVNSPRMFRIDNEKQQINFSDIIDINAFKSRKIKSAVVKLQSKLIDRISTSFDGADPVQFIGADADSSKLLPKQNESSTYLSADSDNKPTAIDTLNTNFSAFVTKYFSGTSADKKEHSELMSALDDVSDSAAMSRTSMVGMTGMLTKLGPILKGAGPVAAVALAGAAGYKLGQWIDKKFSISDKIGDMVGNSISKKDAKKNLSKNETNYLTGDISGTGNITAGQQELGKHITKAFAESGGIDEADPVKRSKLLDEAYLKGIKDFNAARGTKQNIQNTNTAKEIQNLDSNTPSIQNTTQFNKQIKTTSKDKTNNQSTNIIKAASDTVNMDETNQLLKDLVKTTKDKKHKSIVIQPRDNTPTILTNIGEY